MLDSKYGIWWQAELSCSGLGNILLESLCCHALILLCPHAVVPSILPCPGAKQVAGYTVLPSHTEGQVEGFSC